MKRKKKERTLTFCETDLATERSCAKEKKEGVFYKESEWGGIRFSALRVSEEAATAEMKAGRSLSLSYSAPFLWGSEERKEAIRALIIALRIFFPKLPSRLLVAGLGNRRLTADSLGPLTAERISVSAALPASLFAKMGESPATRVAVCIPDVFPKTGIESVRTVAAAARLHRADAILTVDALAAREKERLLRVTEITDTGTVPGGGVKTGTLSLSQKTVGIPVISIGVPTVVRADAEYFLVSRDLEEEIAITASWLAEGIDLYFGGGIPHEDAPLDGFFSELET